MTLEEFKIIDPAALPIGKLIMMAARGYSIYLNRHLNDLNINTTQLHLLFEIAHQKDINQDKIASRCNINKSAVARSIRKLEEKGLVERKIDENNRRQNIVSLTYKGKETLNECIRRMDEWEREIYHDFDIIDEETFKKALKELVIRTIKLNQKGDSNDKK